MAFGPLLQGITKERKKTDKLRYKYFRCFPVFFEFQRQASTFMPHVRRISVTCEHRGNAAGALAVPAGRP
jgi:hypothetical protein